MSFPTPDPREAAFQTVLDACTPDIMTLLRLVRDGADLKAMGGITVQTTDRARDIGVIDEGIDMLTDLGRLVLERKG